LDNPLIPPAKLDKTRDYNIYPKLAIPKKIQTIHC